MSLLISEGVAPDLDQIAIHEDARGCRLSGNIDRAARAQLHARSVELKDGVLRQNTGVLEQVDIPLLKAPDRVLGLVQNELLAGQRAGGNVEPAVLESALHQAPGDPRRHAEQAKADD